VTVHEYSAGRRSRSTTTREAEFDSEQIDYLLAIDEFERSIGPHGHPLSEATADDADPNNYDGGYSYVGLGPYTDWAKKAELDAADAYKAAFDPEHPPNMNGLYFTVQKRESTP
jgi:hypothetical protein